MIETNDELFKSIFREALEEDEIEFTEVDLSGYEPLFEKFENVEVSYNGKYHIYRVELSINGQYYVKYIGERKINLNTARELADIDDAVTERVDDAVDYVRSSRDISNSKPLPQHSEFLIAKIAKNRIDNTNWRDSHHLKQCCENHKPGHGIVLKSLFDNWIKRVYTKCPTDIDYILINECNENLIIPVNVTYKGFVKELSVIFKHYREIHKRRIQYVKPDFLVKPGLCRVYALLNKDILTEFLFCISPNKEKSLNLISTDDSKVQAWGPEYFTKEQLKSIDSLILSSMKYFRGYDD